MEIMYVLQITYAYNIGAKHTLAGGIQCYMCIYITYYALVSNYMEIFMDK